MGSPKAPKVPELSAEERALFQKQGVALDQVNDILSQERVGSEQSQNILRQLTGLYDAEGNLDQEALNSLRSRALATQQAEQGIGQQALDQLGNIFNQGELGNLSDQVGVAEASRLLQALQGTEPSAAIKNEEDRAFKLLKESAGQRGIKIQGNDLFSATSNGTAGNQLIAELRRNAEARRDAERQSIINQGTAANLDRLGFGLNQRNFGFNAAQSLRPDIYGQTAGQLSGAQTIGPSSLVNSYLGLGQAFGNSAQPYREQRYLNYQNDLQNYADRVRRRENRFGLIGGGLGAVAGGVIGGPQGAQLGYGLGSGAGRGLSQSF